MNVENAAKSAGLAAPWTPTDIIDSTVKVWEIVAAAFRWQDSAFSWVELRYLRGL